MVAQPAQKHQFWKRLVSLVVAQAFLFTSVFPAWANPSTMLRTTSTTHSKDGALRDIQKDLGDASAVSYLHPNDIAAGLTPESTIGDRERLIHRWYSDAANEFRTAPLLPVAGGDVALPITRENIHPIVFDAVKTLNAVEGIETYASGPDEMIGDIQGDLETLRKDQMLSAMRGLPMHLQRDRPGHFRAFLNFEVKLKDAKRYWDLFAKRLVKISFETKPLTTARAADGGIKVPTAVRKAAVGTVLLGALAANAFLDSSEETTLPQPTQAPPPAVASPNTYYNELSRRYYENSLTAILPLRMRDVVATDLQGKTEEEQLAELAKRILEHYALLEAAEKELLQMTIKVAKDYTTIRNGKEHLVVFSVYGPKKTLRLVFVEVTPAVKKAWESKVFSENLAGLVYLVWQGVKEDERLDNEKRPIPRSRPSLWDSINLARAGDTEAAAQLSRYDVTDIVNHVTQGLGGEGVIDEESVRHYLLLEVLAVDFKNPNAQWALKTASMVHLASHAPFEVTALQLLVAFAEKDKNPHAIEAARHLKFSGLTIDESEVIAFADANDPETYDLISILADQFNNPDAKILQAKFSPLRRSAADGGGKIAPQKLPVSRVRQKFQIGKDNLFIQITSTDPGNQIVKFNVIHDGEEISTKAQVTKERPWLSERALAFAAGKGEERYLFKVSIDHVEDRTIVLTVTPYASTAADGADKFAAARDGSHHTWKDRFSPLVDFNHLVMTSIFFSALEIARSSIVDYRWNPPAEKPYFTAVNWLQDLVTPMWVIQTTLLLTSLGSFLLPTLRKATENKKGKVFLRLHVAVPLFYTIAELLSLWSHYLPPSILSKLKYGTVFAWEDLASYWGAGTISFIFHWVVTRLFSGSDEIHFPWSKPKTDNLKQKQKGSDTAQDGADKFAAARDGATRLIDLVNIKIERNHRMLAETASFPKVIKQYREQTLQTRIAQLEQTREKIAVKGPFGFLAEFSKPLSTNRSLYRLVGRFEKATSRLTGNEIRLKRNRIFVIPSDSPLLELFDTVDVSGFYTATEDGIVFLVSRQEDVGDRLLRAVYRTPKQPPIQETTILHELWHLAGISHTVDNEFLKSSFIVEGVTEYLTERLAQELHMPYPRQHYQPNNAFVKELIRQLGIDDQAASRLLYDLYKRADTEPLQQVLGSRLPLFKELLENVMLFYPRFTTYLPLVILQDPAFGSRELDAAKEVLRRIEEIGLLDDSVLAVVQDGTDMRNWASFLSAQLPAFRIAEWAKRIAHGEAIEAVEPELQQRVFRAKKLFLAMQSAARDGASRVGLPTEEELVHFLTTLIGFGGVAGNGLKWVDSNDPLLAGKEIVLTRRMSKLEPEEREPAPLVFRGEKEIPVFDVAISNALRSDPIRLLELLLQEKGLTHHHSVIQSRLRNWKVRSREEIPDFAEGVAVEENMTGSQILEKYFSHLLVNPDNLSNPRKPQPELWGHPAGNPHEGYMQINPDAEIKRGTIVALFKAPDATATDGGLHKDAVAVYNALSLIQKKLEPKIDAEPTYTAFLRLQQVFARSHQPAKNFLETLGFNGSADRMSQILESPGKNRLEGFFLSTANGNRAEIASRLAAARDGARRITITHDTDVIGAQHFRVDQPVIRLFHNRAFLDSPFPAKGFVADRERFGRSFGTDDSGVRDVLVLADHVKGDFFENVNDALARSNVVGLLGSKIRIFHSDFSLVIPGDRSGTSQIVAALQKKFGDNLRIELIGPRKWADSMEGLLQEFGTVEVLKIVAASETPLAEDDPTSMAHAFNDTETTQTLDQFLQGTRGFVSYTPTALDDAALRNAYFDYRITARGV